MSTTGCQLTFSVSILLKLNFLSLVFLNNCLSLFYLLYIFPIMLFSRLLIMLAIWVSSLIKISLFLNTFLLFLHAAPALWNSLASDFRHFSSHYASSQSNLNPSIFALSHSIFLKKLKTYLFHFSFPP